MTETESAGALHVPGDNERCTADGEAWPCVTARRALELAQHRAQPFPREAAILRRFEAFWRRNGEPYRRAVEAHGAELVDVARAAYCSGALDDTYGGEDIDQADESNVARFLLPIDVDEARGLLEYFGFDVENDELPVVDGTAVLRVLERVAVMLGRVKP